MLSLTAPMLHGLKEAPEELRMAAPTGEYIRKHRLAGHCDRGHTLPTIRTSLRQNPRSFAPGTQPVHHFASRKATK
ncbi:hypothetical protein NOH94_003572 [Salmonella enterica]|nr:hypothetical protein [Salmonella enterica]EJM3859753.1 hypothetical protein [Salmonella enterica]EJX4187868.1 hypothetical protein [Salmonella enterica]EJX4476334.1 hypothetical protein [Salmonella enterica]EKS4544809.1 hypothetical protein [Salmonella enterica]